MKNNDKNKDSLIVEIIITLVSIAIVFYFITDFTSDVPYSHVHDGSPMVHQK